jgi:hypothetical protein
MNSISSNDNKNGTNNLCCIVIPVYKDKLSEYEMMSLRQCCNVLGKHPIFFVAYNGLDCTVYAGICKDAGIYHKIEFFDKKYFSDIYCYNALLFSKKFYLRFNTFKYMLIYHLDAYVFRDELEYWCKKGYDYIGAPWLSLDSSKAMPVFNGSLVVGNGRFSLRNITKVLAFHSKKISIVGFIQLFQSYYNLISRNSKNIINYVLRFFLRPILKILKFVFFKYDDAENDEDKVWSRLFQKYGNVPSAAEAMKFSFENFPEYLYRLNNEELPFGCHEWFKYYNYLFYKKHICNNNINESIT